MFLLCSFQRLAAKSAISILITIALANSITIVNASTREGKDSTNVDNISRYNQQNVEFVGKSKGKQAKLVYCQLGISSGSTLVDENVMLNFVTGNFNSEDLLDPPGFYHSGFSQNIGLQVSVQNLTMQVVYIDLANTFVMRSGEATAYYVPSATSSTTMKSSGTSVNLGAVAEGIGVGGVAGTIASGVNVGSGKSVGTTNTVFSQRIIAIPPKSVKKLEFQKFFPYGFVSGMFKGGYIYGAFNNKLQCAQTTEKININVGEQKTWNEIESPQTFGLHVTYSFDENCQQANSLFTNFYMMKMIGASRGRYMFGANMKDFTNNWKDALYFIVNNE